MADTDIIYQVEGPIKVQWRAPPGGSFATLGHSPNRERPQFSTEWLGEELGDDEHGDEVVDIVYTGKIATLQFTLARWNKSEVDIMLATATPGILTPVAAEAYEMGVIGTLYSGQTNGIPDQTHLISIKFLSSITGRTIRTFEACYFLGEGVREFEIGNSTARLAFSFRVMRDQTTAVPLVGDDILVKTTA